MESVYPFSSSILEFFLRHSIQNVDKFEFTSRMMYRCIMFSQCMMDSSGEIYHKYIQNINRQKDMCIEKDTQIFIYLDRYVDSFVFIQIISMPTVMVFSELSSMFPLNSHVLSANTVVQEITPTNSNNKLILLLPLQSEL